MEVLVKPNNIQSFDKIREEKPENMVGIFKCFNCSSKNIILVPVGVSYKCQKNNNDIKNEKLSRGYDGLLNYAKAVLSANDVHNVLCVCNDCGLKRTIIEGFNRFKLTNYLKKEYPSMFKKNDNGDENGEV